LTRASAERQSLQIRERSIEFANHAILGYSSLALNRLDKSKKALTRTSDGSTLRLSKF
jgi:hypothetical protein